MPSGIMAVAGTVVIQYNCYMSEENNPLESENIAENIKTGTLFFDWWKLIKSLVFLVIFSALAVYFVFRGQMPWYIPVFFIAVLAVIIILQIVTMRKTSRSLDSSQATQTKDQQATTIAVGETLQAYIPAIMYTGFRMMPALGTGDLPHPENALLLTDQHLLFIFVPLLGADKVIQNQNIGQFDWMAASADIQNKLDQMLSSMSIEQIYQSYPKNFGIALDNLDSVSFSNFPIATTFKTKDGKKYSYSIRNPEDVEKAKQLFANFIR